MAAKYKKAKSSSKKNYNLIKEIFSVLSSNLMYLAMYSFVFISVVSYAITPIPTKKNTPKLEITNDVLAAQDTTVKIVPFLVPHEGVTVPVFSALGIEAVDMNSGRVLFEKNPDEPLFPASTVKMITALVVLDNFHDSDVITVGNPNVEGQKMDLVPGEKITVGNLIQGLLVYSANDAAEVFAENFRGGRDLFIRAMNDKVMEIGAQNTYLSNPTGLDGAGQVTTASDMVKIAQYAMQNPEFSSIVGKREVNFASIDGIYKYDLKTTNQLLGVVDGVKGVKTGWTENARENLVTYVERDDKRIMIALLGSQDRFGESRQLIEWIFANYKWEEM